MTVNGLRPLGSGVAYTLAAPQIHSLHEDLSISFTEYLSPQDRQKFQPHVVIQNKSTATKARELLALLKKNFQSFPVEAIGFDLWHYLGGPWELAGQFDFVA